MRVPDTPPLDPLGALGRRCAALLGTGLLLLQTGCLFAPPPVRVAPRNAQALLQDVDTCALYGRVPSARTTWFLRLLESEDAYARDPVATLRPLHEHAATMSTRNGLFFMAELAYLAGTRAQSEESFLAAATYAYLYLFGDDLGPPPSPYDRRFRWACDIYNRALVQAFTSREDGALRLVPGRRELPFGSLQIDVDYSAFPFETEGLAFLPADELDVVGLDYRVRDAGLGAPLIAIVQRRGDGTAGVGILDETSVTATLLLRIHGDFGDLGSGLSAALQLYVTHEATTIDVRGERVPLEADPTATLAYGLQKSDLRSLDFAGFFGGRNARRQNGLILPQPFEPGRIPVVLVHGTASDPSKWAELLNSLESDPRIRSRVQFWLFLYASGNPVIYSAASLRESLQSVVRKYDPEGRDESLQNMVLVGHSQGGLLAKLALVHMDAEEICEQVLGQTLEELRLDEQGYELLHQCFDLEPLPFVGRVVFVATPHRGSYIAGSWFSRLLAKLISVPGEVANTSQQIVRQVPRTRLPGGMESHVPTSLDNMNPGNPVLLVLAETPIDPRVEVHSIIPIGDASEPAGASDGVVKYESAHLEGVNSELLVPSKHSCQSHPRTILEIRRILYEHIQSIQRRDAGQSIDGETPRSP